MLRMSEVYLSTQGEGPRVGERTVFVRFAGCNLRCPGWPCDTQYAIDPEKYRHEWKNELVETVYDTIDEHLIRGIRTNVCFTGGEPFLQKHSELGRLWGMLSRSLHVGTIEAFTNGTIKYPDWALSYVRMVMDWKLPGSGEDPYDENRFWNLKMLTGTDTAIKFVIANREDFDLACQLYFNKRDPSGFQFYYGVAWDKLETSELVKWVLDAGLPWKLNVQVHNYIWPRDERAR